MCYPCCLDPWTCAQCAFAVCELMKPMKRTAGTVVYDAQRGFGEQIVPNYPYMEAEVHQAPTSALPHCPDAASKMKSRSSSLVRRGIGTCAAQVEYCTKHEYAVTVKDMLTTRMRLAFLNSEAAKQASIGRSLTPLSVSALQER